MRNPVYFIWYELVVGAERTRHTFALTMTFLNKKAESTEDMSLIHKSTHAYLMKHHGGEGLTINITGMEYLRSELAPNENGKRKSNNTASKGNRSAKK